MNENLITAEDKVLVDEMIVSLVWGLPDDATISVGQIKELAPHLARIIERKHQLITMDVGEANSYIRIRDFIKKDFPNAFLEASRVCSRNNCQSMPTILITAIELLTKNNDLDISNS